MQHSLTRPAYDTGATSRSIKARAAPEVGAVHTAGAEGRAVRGDPSRHWTDSKNIWPRSWRTYGAERDERAVAERVLERASEQLADERASARPTPGQRGWAAGRDADPRQGGEVVLSDGTLIATQPCTGKADRWDCSGKHHHHGLRFLAPTDERGRLIWTIRRRPGRTHDNTAARQDHVMAHLRAATLGASADLGYRGLDNDVLDPVIVTGFLPAAPTSSPRPEDRQARPHRRTRPWPSPGAQEQSQRIQAEVPARSSPVCLSSWARWVTESAAGVSCWPARPLSVDGGAGSAVRGLLNRVRPA